MPTWESIVADISINWWLYALMPVIAAVIGYATKIAAIQMMFYPLKFVGLGPIGWQGVVPAQANKMARTACETLTRDLIRPRELFDRLDPNYLVTEVEKPLLVMLDDIVREVASHYDPTLWETLPEAIRRQVIRRVQNSAPEMVRAMMDDMRNNLDTVFDFEDMVVTALTEDPERLNRMFQQTGASEFRFIRRSGIYFGFTIGLVQAAVWALTHNPWVIPIFGGLTGWLTDWLALKLIFEPRQPARVFGIFPWHGLFMKRRDEVAADYGKMIADEVLTPANLIRGILNGPASDQLYELVQRHVRRAVDEQASVARPLLVFRMGSRNYQEMKRSVAQKIMEHAPETLLHVQDYATEAMDLHRTLIEKVKDLTDEEFEGLLRPIFKAEEWKLIAAGAVLGFLVGELQVQVMVPLMTVVN